MNETDRYIVYYRVRSEDGRHYDLRQRTADMDCAYFAQARAEFSGLDITAVYHGDYRKVN